MKNTLTALMLTGLLALPVSGVLAGMYGSHGKTSAMPVEKDIVATAVSAGSFNTLVTALKAADLVTTLQGEGPFTVFAPTDAAFEKLDADTLADLLKPENKEQLAAILTYHVVPGKYLAENVVNMELAKTVNGKSLQIATGGGAVKVNDAEVIKTDILTSNGVIHVIDTVVLP